jgi:hypothetical protein
MKEPILQMGLIKLYQEMSMISPSWLDWVTEVDGKMGFHLTAKGGGGTLERGCVVMVHGISLASALANTQQ